MFNKIKNKIKNKSLRPEKIEDEKVNDFLKNFNCSNCHNNCTLNNIRCGGGIKAQSEAIKNYEKELEKCQ